MARSHCERVRLIVDPLPDQRPCTDAAYARHALRVGNHSVRVDEDHGERLNIAGEESRCSAICIDAVRARVLVRKDETEEAQVEVTGYRAFSVKRPRTRDRDGFANAPSPLPLKTNVPCSCCAVHE